MKKQRLTVSLERSTIRKAKALAARRGTSVSALVAGLIEELVGKGDEYERVKREALALLKKGFNLGGKITATRDELHER